MIKVTISIPAFLFSLAVYNKATAQINDSLCDQYLSKAKNYIGEDQYRKAIPFLDSCIGMNNKDAAVYNLRGCATIYQDVLNDTKNNQQAILFFNKAIAMDSTNYWYIANRAHAWQNLDKFKKSLSDYKKALSLDTTNVELHGDVLRSLWIQNRNKEAFAYCSKIIQQFPAHGYAWYVRGQLKRDYLHQYPEGNKDIKKSEELGWAQGLRLYY